MKTRASKREIGRWRDLKEIEGRSDSGDDDLRSDVVIVSNGDVKTGDGDDGDAGTGIGGGSDGVAGTGAGDSESIGVT